ncbi:MAG TPA: phytanoyl-CoA dioxygenase family protein [Saprospiraceae bacterium]|nr:phytanoyl-CoA dioxygenase family protein [Saprospiraceae bacterium]HZV45525.1 phytanoyl-CoA dioxygenase family protein [Saprospiraceae bacterium]
MSLQASLTPAPTTSRKYQVFTLGTSLTNEQKEFFHKNGFIHFKNFVSKEVVDKMISESERIQDEWIAEDRKLVNGTPIKYGKDVDGKTIVQRFAFLNQFGEIFQEFIGDPRLLALFELNGKMESRLGVNEKDGLVFNHYVNTEDSNYSQLAWHTDVLRDIFYGNKVMPMLNLGLHLDYSSPENGGLRLIPGTHNKGIGTLLFRKLYYLDYKEDKEEVGLTVEPGDLTIHDGRLWHRVAQSPLIGEKSRRRVMYIPIICGKYEPRTKNSKPLLYQRFMAVTNK